MPHMESFMEKHVVGFQHVFFFFPDAVAIFFLKLISYNRSLVFWLGGFGVSRNLRFRLTWEKK